MAKAKTGRATLEGRVRQTTVRAGAGTPGDFAKKTRARTLLGTPGDFAKNTRAKAAAAARKAGKGGSSGS